jgi:hypothetical protein
MTKQSILWFLALVLLSFTACEEETFGPVLVPGDAPALMAPAVTSFVIVEGTEAENFTTFSWSAADFGVSTQVSYVLEADLAENNFSDLRRLVAGLTATEAAVTNGTINSFLISRGVAGGVPQDLMFRVKAFVGIEGDGNVLYSDPVILNVTPFEAEMVFAQLWVPGSYQGWDPPTAPGVFSLPDNGIYEGFVYFGEDNSPFKFTLAPNWDNGDFGDTDADGSLDAGGTDIVLPGTAGMYRLNANVNDLTYAITPTNWGLIGSATPTGWDSDTDLVYDPATGLLSVTVDLIGGEKFKFRANDEWSIDFGDNGQDGIVEYGGADIELAESGNYTIVLDLTGAIYQYTITQN